MPDQAPDEAPPFLGRWPNVYALVLATLALDIVVLYLFTKAFA
jgi:hypothetical protein